MTASRERVPKNPQYLDDYRTRSQRPFDAKAAAFQPSVIAIQSGDYRHMKPAYDHFPRHSYRHAAVRSQTYGTAIASGGRTSARSMCRGPFPVGPNRGLPPTASRQSACYDSAYASSLVPASRRQPQNMVSYASDGFLERYRLKDHIEMAGVGGIIGLAFVVVCVIALIFASMMLRRHQMGLFQQGFDLMAAYEQTIGIVPCDAVQEEDVSGEFSSLFDSENAEEDGTPEYPTYVATFFGGDDDWTDTLYVSDDCQTFRAVGTVPNEQRDPCIMYHEGRFWVVTCLNDEDGNLWLMVSSSTDLKHWVGPTKNGPFSLDRLPAWEFEGAYDVVAPEWYQAPDGSVHVIVSCGFWGYCHGQNWNDHMEAYMLDIASFSATDNESRITAAGPAKWMSVNADGDDRIDGNIVFTGGKYYLTIKRHGLWMELWESPTLSPLGWTRIRETCLYGFEAPCVFQTTDGIWHMLADGVPDVEPFGTRRWTAGSLFDTWSETPITFLRQDGSQVPLGGIRHGTVLPIDKPGQGKAFEAVKELLPERSTGSKQEDGTLSWQS